VNVGFRINLANDEERMHMAPDPCCYVLGLAATAPAGQEFFYNTAALTLLSAMIRKATGRTLDDLPEQRCSSLWALPA
jgi:CubicO group peptidase (beta-lactamase class C family)